MIYQTTMIKYTSKTSNQDGISLMLSILVLAAITAISFSLTTIVFIELKSSSDVVKSEPALYATLGATEEALFQYKRYVNERDDGTVVNLIDVPSCMPKELLVCELGGVKISFPVYPPYQSTQPIEFDDPVRLETVYAGATNVIPLYQVNNYELQYNKLELQRVPTNNGNNLLMSVRGFSENPSGADHILMDGVKLNEADGVYSITGFLPGYQYELSLKNDVPLGGDPENIQVSISSFDSGGSPKGLPFIGKKVLKIRADSPGLVTSRTYKVYVPVP